MMTLNYLGGAVLIVVAVTQVLYHLWVFVPKEVLGGRTRMGVLVVTGVLIFN